MAPRTNRTVICSVLFLDIAEYSRKPVAAQIRLKERLNDLLATALADVALNDRIILDTGDGAAISFLGDPEDALFVSMALRDALAGPHRPGASDLHMRIGINLGPVKLITDLNDQPNIIGDGINVAQRVMGFAEPGQILVSRSYYEVISCMSEEHVKLFQYEGSRTDKHVREHEVYAVGPTPPGIQRVSAQGRKETGIGAAQRAMQSRLTETTTIVQDQLRRKPRVATALAVGVILAASIGIRVTLEADRAAEATAEAGAPAGETTAAVAGSAPAEAPPPVQKAQSKPPAPAPAAKAQVREAVKAAPTPPPKAAATETRPPPAGLRDSIQAPQAAAESGTVKLQFAISPWGEIFVDGRKVGVAPPMRELEVEPGRHRIEVRNTTFPAHEQVVDAKPGQEIRIRHKFR